MGASWVGEEVNVLGSYGHGMDRHPALVIEDQNDGLEDIARTVRAEHEESVWGFVVA
jgi:hypothetical protein